MDQTVPKFLGPLLMAASITIAVFGKMSPGVPHWVGYAACAAFFLTGIVLTGMSFGFPWISNYVGPFIIVCMAIIPTWIAFGPGERHCSGSGGLAFLGFAIRHREAAGATECRAVFSFAAVLMWLLLGWGTYYLLFGKKKQQK